jgi:threonine aldolase
MTRADLNWIDLRSDTVTRPTPAMREAMARAPVGDDVYGEDPTVTELETTLAARLGFESGLFVPSGTQSNLVALLSHCGRGDEYIAGQMAHTYRFEGGGAAVLGGIQPQPLPFAADGTLDLAAVAEVIKPDDFHFARTRLLCLENTQAGKAIAPAYFAAARALCEARGLALHLDGARLFNAAIDLAVDPRAITEPCHSVSVCLSKGLGAPVGSVLLGGGEFIARARRWRKVLGGGMRQAGIIAAAGLYALQHHVDRLVDDHRRAAGLATAMRALGFTVEQATNMVFVTGGGDFDALARHLAAARVRIRGPRWVLHLDIDDRSVERVVAALRQYRSGDAAAQAGNGAGQAGDDRS